MPNSDASSAIRSRCSRRPSPAAEKIRPNAQPPAGATAAAKIAAAKNEFESFQVVITGQAGGVSMSLEGLSDGAGHSISGRDVVLYREALINVAWPSGGDGAAGTWPDGLIPDVDPIAGEKETARDRVPDSKGEHADQAREGVASPGQVGVQQDLRIGPGAKAMAKFFQLGATPRCTWARGCT